MQTRPYSILGTAKVGYPFEGVSGLLSEMPNDSGLLLALAHVE